MVASGGRACAVWLVVALAGCRGAEAGAPTVAPAKAVEAREITVLYTSDEHGWIAPRTDRYAHLGGATQLLALLIDREGHCPGALAVAGEEIRPQAPGCDAPSTVLLSGGDNFTGPTLSTHSRGRTMADVMRLFAYDASAFGNHELDFGREAFDANRKRSGVPYLSANMVRAEGAPVLAEPWRIVERNGVKLGVVGVSTEDTIRAAMPHHFAGLSFASVEETLAQAVPEVWQAGADAVVLIAHECHDVIGPIVARHPEWKLSFAGTGHCHRAAVDRAGETVVIAPDWRMEHYGRVRLLVHPSRPQGERAEVIDYGLIDVSASADGPALSADPAFDRLVTGWQRDIDRVMGERIGYSARGLSLESEALGQWVVRSWLEGFPEADVAVTTSGSLRQELPPGDITVGTVHSILPFENELVISEVSVAELGPMLSRDKAIVAGLSCSDGRCTRPDGAPIEAEKVRVVTTDYLYYGGDGFKLARFDPDARFTGVDWRKPVIAATRRAATSPEQPLERLLR